MKEKTTNWILLGLERYWAGQAKILDFQTFVFTYVKLMIIQNREVGLEFWHFVRKNENDTLLETYKKWRK
jgi:hypothetical protein